MSSLGCFYSKNQGLLRSLVNGVKLLQTGGRFAFFPHSTRSGVAAKHDGLLRPGNFSWHKFSDGRVKAVSWSDCVTLQ